MKTFIKSGFWTTKNTGATPKGWLDLTKLLDGRYECWNPFRCLSF